MATTVDEIDADVVIMGGGLAGLASAIFLRNAGIQVLCIDPQGFPRYPLGESFDWSSPGLLTKLGLSRDSLVRQGIATYKRKVVLVPLGTRPFDGRPSDALHGRPFGFETMTLHADRRAFDEQLCDRARDCGVLLVQDRVTKVSNRADRILSCSTRYGREIQARWFIDASGRSQLIRRALGIENRLYGLPKVCIWTYFPSDGRTGDPQLSQKQVDATTLYGDTRPDYLRWIWEIPITSNEVSVGCVVPSAEVRNLSKQGLAPSAILRRYLGDFDRFSPLLDQVTESQMHTVSFQNYVCNRVSGENWLMVGEAAALADPLTANGVTAALRHAEASASLIGSALSREALPEEGRYLYNAKVKRMGEAFNDSIETAAYDWPIRRGIHPVVAFRVYTLFSYLANALYSKFRPETKRDVAILSAATVVAQIWLRSWVVLGRTGELIRRSASFAPIRRSSSTVVKGDSELIDVPK